jgi:hypothetical protein
MREKVERYQVKRRNFFSVKEQWSLSTINPKVSKEEGL